jgi:hypothetical protein
MLGLDSPAIQVEAKHEGVGAEKVESSNAGNLAKRLPLCVGCRVMLTRNLWADVGLVSRVKTLGGLMLENAFDRSRVYRETPSRAMGLKLLDHATRQLQVLDTVAAEDRSEESGWDTGSEYGSVEV